ncbi:NAD(P)/FAD-dependent oxidoreductase [Cellulomonas fimi]|uniref:FAD dependent oxidoreductase n=1 Tax=Cellulomonas fimi (strain ATCC 484 / DSM 20113 / JCM 1341 / CCUG 24087 / LMG 16345 / NBRC 15513 / NCIMB 8980 / NCTC 7547 / NRS-133) TaxID=590998 RepID=F4H723_CELFA|nr:FAD-binding oxidoreductase [Cellulomonas fimi]AEE45657.1 FAD dependent oxidoreductase [Cellulomonas fimi ATCC 484]NNH08049.1 FAD-dependent oxidoreductase [Cellulomonas fimi]VEH30203.1 Gamma-glutamylputrescine oxidoreductase [Cellulomonas fimi]
MATVPRTHPLWLDRLPTEEPRPPLDGDSRADVVVLGAGLSGLWTAYYLLEADPALDVLVVEADVVGGGAAGRGDGWCTADPVLPVPADEVPPDGRALRQALRDAVVEVGGVAAAEQVDCGFDYGGTVWLARHPGALEHLAAVARTAADDDDLHLLGPAEATDLVGADGVLGGLVGHDSARLDPARLARGLRDVVLARGARVVERTHAVRVSPRAVVTDRGTVRTRWSVRALGAWSAGPAGDARAVASRHAVAVTTAPLDAAAWGAVGLGRESFTDVRPLPVRGARTDDGRLLLVDPVGVPAGAGGPAGRDVERAAARLRAALASLFGSLDGAAASLCWTVPLGVARDGLPSVGLGDDGVAWIRGLGSGGAAAANLAGRTVADLVTGADSPLVRLPWVGHRSPAWPAGPLRVLDGAVARRRAERADATVRVPDGVRTPR